MRWMVLLLLVRVATAQGHIGVQVDPRVELFSVVFMLAGNPEYQPRPPSPYAEEARAHFGRFSDHAVVRLARELRRTRGVSYDAVVSLALHVKDARTLAERIPLDTPPARLDKRWRPKEARAFLEAARDFVLASDFAGFLEKHAANHAAAAQRFETRLNERDHVAWFDGFFGKRAGARFGVCLGLLNGRNNYGTSIRFPDGSEEIRPVLGAYTFDKAGLPIPTETTELLLIHEFAHAYVNSVTEPFRDKLAPAGKVIYPRVATLMQPMAYAEWQTVVNESIVRACVVRNMRTRVDGFAARRQRDADIALGFAWMPELLHLIEKDWTNDLAALMPKVIALFDRQARLIAKAPVVVALSPRNGATDVDPETAAIRISFDRPMVDRSFSVLRAGATFPEVAGQVGYDAGKMVLTIPVKLKPDTLYRFALNGPGHFGFRAQDGRAPLLRVEVWFRTR
ncbi:MAG: DUF4932 domain-containing protein [Planctomycetota bacterium]|jgi:hypothetical protein